MNKTLKEDLEKIIDKHNRGLIITGFGQDQNLMSALQPDCLADDILDQLEKIITEREKEVKKRIESKIGSWAHSHAARIENAGCRSCFRDEIIKEILKSLEDQQEKEKE